LLQADAEEATHPMVGPERRLDQERPASVLERQLNEDQRHALRQLERFGWELKFVRRKLFQDPIAVIFDQGRQHFAEIDASGALNETPEFRIRE
jgi:hypothetical protein